MVEDGRNLWKSSGPPAQVGPPRAPVGAPQQGQWANVCTVCLSISWLDPLPARVHPPCSNPFPGLWDLGFPNSCLANKDRGKEGIQAFHLFHGEDMYGRYPILTSVMKYPSISEKKAVGP